MKSIIGKTLVLLAICITLFSFSQNPAEKVLKFILIVNH